MQTKHTQFIYEEARGVARIALNRPEKLNAISLDLFHELLDTFTALQREDSVRAVLLTGQGRGFSSGADLDATLALLFTMGTKGVAAFNRMAGSLALSICQLRKPVIAALNGVTVGAGAVLALACDLRIAAEGTKIFFPFTRIGLSAADTGAVYLLPRIVGTARAMELLCLGEPITAERAEQIGLVNRVVRASDLETEAIALAQKLAAGPTFAMGMTKVQIYNEWNMTLPAAIEAEAQAQAICMLTEEFEEGYRAFKEKRAPKFSE